jgi:fermentation-respiration switch protein FrsA (DUF1100 family)
MEAFWNAVQSWMIFPGQFTPARLSARLAAPAGGEIVTFPAIGERRCFGLYGGALYPDGSPRSDAAARPTLIFFHGNCETIAFPVCQWLFREFRSLGANVLLPEYIGYGASRGRASEADCYATADAVYAYLTQERQVAPTRMVVTGWSLGGAVAIDLAARKPVGGLAAFSTFTSIEAVGQRRFPFLPVSRYLKHHFRSEAKIGQVACPILLAHGRRDLLIPYDMSLRLEAAATAPVTRLTVPLAGHNDLFLFGMQPIRESLRRLLEQAAA